MVKYLALAGALLGTLAFAEMAEARHGRGGCAGGSCYSGGYSGGYYGGYYAGGCSGGACGVQTYAPAYPAYPAYAPGKAAVTYSSPAVVTAPAARPVVAPTVVQPAARYYYYTNTGRWGGGR